MTSTIRPAVLFTALIASSIVLTGCTINIGTQSPMGGSNGLMGQNNSGFSGTDIMFAQMMIPHHQQAVQMSEIMLAKDNLDPQIQQLAQKIVAAQGPEIEQLQAMLETWGEPTSMESGGMEGMDHGSTGSASGSGMEGMMTEEDMGQLEAAEGDEAARLFLTQMTEHHRGAIDMAQEEVANGQNRQAIAMAQKVVKDQEAEIQEMNTLLERFQG